jgi:hypothetical protein
MITFAGFSALLLGVRPAAGARIWGSAVTLAMLGYVLAGLPCSAAAFITALTIDFFAVVFGYLIALDVVMRQPMEVSNRQAPR